MERVNGVSKPSFSYGFHVFNKFPRLRGKLEHIRSNVTGLLLKSSVSSCMYNVESHLLHACCDVNTGP